jgi:UDP-N-acetylglucosamine:LPS N-acetylglucosamine transferase
MNEKISIKSVCELIWQLENDYNLIQLEVQGVKVWELLRYKISNYILQKKQIYGQAHTERTSFFDKLRAVPMYVINTLTKNPIWGPKKSILVFDHPRKIYIENKYIDIYTNHLIKNFNQKEYEVIESEYLKKHFSNRKETNRKYLDSYFFYSLPYRVFYKNRFKSKEEKIFKLIEAKIYKTFNVKIDLSLMVIKEIKNFQLKYCYYKKILKNKKPNVIYLVVSYAEMPLIAAAKYYGIKVIELQHGIISPYHLGYNFPHGNKEVKYFPDEIYLFGSYWSKSINFPLDKSQLKIYGFPFMTEKMKQYDNVQKKKKQIIILSQGSIGRHLSSFSYELAKLLPDYHFVYKLHPGEFDRWEEEYPDLLEASTLSNFLVVNNNEKHLYKFLAESEYQLGVYSTALFEGLAFGCKTILYNTHGIEYMEELINKGYVYLAENSYDAYKLINKFPEDNVKKDDFFR